MKTSRPVLHPALLRPLVALALSVAALGGTSPAHALVAGDPIATAEPTIATSPKAKPSVRGRQGNYTASVFVATSARRAWSLLTDYEAMAGVMPDIKEAKVLSRSGSSLEVMQVYQAPYTFGRRIKATLAMREVAPRQLSYHLIQGDQIKTLKGSWTITPVSGGVIVRHQIQVDPEVPGFVRPLYYELTEANLLQSMTILKRLMEQT